MRARGAGPGRGEGARRGEEISRGHAAPAGAGRLRDGGAALGVLGNGNGGPGAGTLGPASSPHRAPGHTGSGAGLGAPGKRDWLRSVPFPPPPAPALPRFTSAHLTPAPRSARAAPAPPGPALRSGAGCGPAPSALRLSPAAAPPVPPGPPATGAGAEPRTARWCPPVVPARGTGRPSAQRWLGRASGCCLSLGQHPRVLWPFLDQRAALGRALVPHKHFMVVVLSGVAFHTCPVLRLLYSLRLLLLNPECSSPVGMLMFEDAGG